MSTQPSLCTEIFGCTLKNPLILASGILGTTRDILKRVFSEGAGAATIKSISVNPRKGHNNPTVLNFGPGCINAVGYSNPGVKKAVEEYSDLSGVGGPVIGSLIGSNIEEFAQMAAAFDPLGFAALEIPVSCPHTPGFGKMARQDDPDTIREIVKAVCAHTSKPVFIKLPAAANNMVELALAAKEAGAYGLTAVNTVGPGMLINIETGRPYLGFGIGGISGPALKPLAIAATYQLSKEVGLPIIGTGGVSTGADAIEMIMAGATAVGVGTAVLSGGPSAFAQIAGEMTQILAEKGVSSLKDVRGLAHGE
ncbi:MAG: dihydroorotate dehydrogenase [Candidatus Omnitrophica bacterium]|nr:dihydroorotate dehydrogenase [Candidatus Omnitrophota bacterium]